MKSELYNYRIFPMIFPAGDEVTLTVKPLGDHAAFRGEYHISVHRLDAGSPRPDGCYAYNRADYDVSPDEDGCLRITYTAASEGEHFVRVFKDDRRVFQLPVYALDEDLACRIPLRGDLHMHTCRSDGREAPAIVCANYRRLGYDFIVVTDHGRYYPSLEAMQAYKDVNIALNILPGEEVHLPETDTHIVNAGGLFSVNGLLQSSANWRETDGADDKRKLDDTVNAPAIISAEQYKAQIDAVEASLTDVPDKLNTRWYAVTSWAYNKIREADGLAIFAHPYWISDMWQMPEVFTRYTLEKHEFDAFEVLGGENYYEQNGFQTAIYYDEYRQGRVHPIVGSTDSHGSTEHNRNADICSTIVFAPANERKAILTAIKERYSVAVDTISKEYRIVGEFRLQKYASFLMENYFPLHDRQAALDGELMREYVLGTATKEEVELISVRAEKLTNSLILKK
ncbi:MAG: hypothetical protein IJC71_00040 [Clostridia bacterium]|nr:hypothetical protein [Clostridia bacterium]